MELDGRLNRIAIGLLVPASMPRVPLSMEHPPHIGVILAFNIEYEIGIAGQLPATQAGQAQFVSRAASWMSGYELVDPFECVDEAKRNARSSLASAVVTLRNRGRTAILFKVALGWKNDDGSFNGRFSPG